MSLKKYQRLRNFEKTPEPKETLSQRKQSKLVYAIQEHRSAHHHFDLRLEEGGVLKSWAIPKEPPMRAGVRRLAVQTEDHPLGYEKFEGIIPEGEYGAGHVEIWDEGDYEILEALPSKRILEIGGRRLRGRFALIKLKQKDVQKKDDSNWLFIKLKDDNK